MGLGGNIPPVNGDLLLQHTEREHHQRRGADLRPADQPLQVKRAFIPTEPLKWRNITFAMILISETCPRPSSR